jgi:hypothetical protein
MKLLVAGLKNTLLIIFSILISLLGAELFFRYTGIGEYSIHSRLLFYTQPSLVVDPQGAVRYSKNTQIRTVAIYGKYIDYDVTKRTNNMGFLDTIDYEPPSPETEKIAFVGDSFTAGSGVNDIWVSQLRDRRKSKEQQFYNLGVIATGFHHFSKILSSFREDIEFDSVNIMVISVDFLRPFWLPSVKENGMWLCINFENGLDNCGKGKPIIRKTTHSETQPMLLKRAFSMYEANHRIAEDKSGKFYRKLNSYKLFCDVFKTRFPNSNNIEACPHLKYNYNNSYDKNAKYAATIKTLRDLMNKPEFKNVKFRLFHIPEKGETISQKYSLDVAEDLREIDLEYIPLLHNCQWNKSMYHKHDTHPNAKGYANLVECMSKHF